jgi:hypothetical protein
MARDLLQGFPTRFRPERFSAPTVPTDPVQPGASLARAISPQAGTASSGETSPLEAFLGTRHRARLFSVRPTGAPLPGRRDGPEHNGGTGR